MGQPAAESAAVRGARLGFVDAGSHDRANLGINDATRLGIADDFDAGVTFEGGVSTTAGDRPDVEDVDDVVCSIGHATGIPNEGVIVRGGVLPTEGEWVTTAWTDMLDAPETSDALFRRCRGSAAATTWVHIASQQCRPGPWSGRWLGCASCALRPHLQRVAHWARTVW